MSIIRKAKAQWLGSGKTGKGTVSVDSGLVKDSPVTFATRFESAAGTNPEELIAAAHASCFSMKLSFVLGELGFTPDELNTEAKVSLNNGAIDQVDLVLTAKIPDISQEQFAAATEDAKNNCPVSKLLNAQINLSAQLL